MAWLLQNGQWDDQGEWDDLATWYDAPQGLWLLAGGVWNDAGVWDDNATWPADAPEAYWLLRDGVWDDLGVWDDSAFWMDAVVSGDNMRVAVHGAAEVFLQLRGVGAAAVTIEGDALVVAALVGRGAMSFSVVGFATFQAFGQGVGEMSVSMGGEATLVLAMRGEATLTVSMGGEANLVANLFVVERRSVAIFGFATTRGRLLPTAPPPNVCTQIFGTFYTEHGSHRPMQIWLERVVERESQAMERGVIVSATEPNGTFALCVKPGQWDLFVEGRKWARIDVPEFGGPYNILDLRVFFDSDVRTFEQVTVSSEWVIPHGRNRPILVMVMDSEGQELISAVDQSDKNVCRVRHVAARSGSVAYL